MFESALFGVVVQTVCRQDLWSKRWMSKRSARHNGDFLGFLERGESLNSVARLSLAEGGLSKGQTPCNPGSTAH